MSREHKIAPADTFFHMCRKVNLVLTDNKGVFSMTTKARPQ